MNKRLSLVIAIVAAALVAGIRSYYESSMPELVPTDAQGGIWIVYSAVMGVGTFFLCLILVYGSLAVLSKKNYVIATILFGAFLFIWGCTGNTLFRYSEIRTALTDAANPTTSPERLSELIGFPTGFGYEIDNRIASNPNSTEEILRTLSKKDQLGTLMCLARNPNTPDDVLAELSKNPDKWIQQSLENNPRNRE
jgi:hypothetical protein